jgi:hypothetical protein
MMQIVIAVDVIRHDGKRIHTRVGKMIRDFPQTRGDDVADRIQNHGAPVNVTERHIAAVGSDGDKIRPRPSVIITV